MAYAENTTVSVYRSIEEIHKIVSRYGADQFMHGAREEAAIVSFVAHERLVRFIIPLPSKDDSRFSHTPTGRERKKQSAAVAWEQECRRRYRSLALAVKAKLEAVESGITSFEQEFLAYIVTPDGMTIGEWAVPQLEAGGLPAALPFFDGDA